VINGKLEGEGHTVNRTFEYPATYWIDRETGVPIQVLQGDYVTQIVSFTPNDIAALDASKYVYTPQPDWKILNPR